MAAILGVILRLPPLKQAPGQPAAASRYLERLLADRRSRTTGPAAGRAEC